MAELTETFKSAGSNFGKTISQSWSMITGRDVPNYSLLYLDHTTTRKRGEHETIVMPHIVLGRSPKCHVRYGDKYKTVSREHASISNQGNQFLLNHNPAASNPTYVNGRTIGGSYVLQNGDEIQLSTNGPKIRFNTSSLKTSTIGLTSRIGQAMGQAIKPYKQALYVLSFLLIGALAFAGYNMYQNTKLDENIQNLETELVELNEAKLQVDREIDGLIAQGKENSREMEALKKRKAQIIVREKEVVKVIDNSSLQDEEERPSRTPVAQVQETDGCYEKMSDMDAAPLLPSKDVVVIIGKRIEVIFGRGREVIGETEFYQYSTDTQSESRDGITMGTGFLTENSDLLTCRHVIEPWIYYKTQPKNQDFWRQLNVIEANGGTIVMHFQVLASDGERYDISTSEIHTSRANDKIVDGDRREVRINIFGRRNNLKLYRLPNKTKENSEQFSDWARVPMNIRGETKIDQRKSEQLEQGRKLFILGYPEGLTLTDRARRIEPSLSTSTVSNSELFNQQIFTSGGGIGYGNSGGPAYICVDGEFICVGIVSHVVGRANAIVVPIGMVRGAY